MTRIGRNAPCPCGSGRKYKLCCGKPVAGPKPVVDGSHLRLHVALRDCDPPIWRRFLLRSDATFADLHAAIQALGWEDAHLWNFTAPSRAVIAGLPDDSPLFGEPAPDARNVSLADYFDAPGKACTYTYDFGDSWEHDVVLEELERHELEFERELIDGAGVFPPEDCGGLPGLERLREYLATGVDPWDDEESAQRWAQSWRGDSFELERERLRFGAPPPTVSRETEAPSPAPSPEPTRVEELDERIVGAIAEAAERSARHLGHALGLSIEMAGAKYNRLNAMIELEVSIVREDGLVMDARAIDFLERCDDFGLHEDDLGRVFECGDETFQVIGLRPRAKTPVICSQLEPDGSAEKRVRLGAALVREHLARAAAQTRGPRLVTDENAAGDPAT